MPYELELNLLPAGISLSAARGGEMVPVQYRGMATSEDGEWLIRCLGFADDLLEAIASKGSRIRASEVDHMAAIIRKDRTATVYVNELELISTCRSSRAVRAGEALTKDDIVDLGKAEFDGIDIPPEAGVILICSSGWRKGVFFDFGPITANVDEPRDFSPWQKLGEVLARLFFQERFAITIDDWSALFATRWFPFAGLCNRSIDLLLGHVRAGWGVQELLPIYREEIRRKVDGFLASWSNKEAYQEHMQVLVRGVERFKSDDYVSSTSILYPRIEGILRSHHIRAALPGGRGQEELASCAVASFVDNPSSLLLPQRFQEYLRTCFFAPFDENTGTIPFSRNSVGHGIACENEFNLESALIALLVCHQLYYCIPTATAEPVA